MRTEPKMTHPETDKPDEVMGTENGDLVHWHLRTVTVPYEDGWVTLTFDLWRRPDETYEVRVMHVGQDDAEGRDREVDLEVLDASGHSPGPDGWYRPVSWA